MNRFALPWVSLRLAGSLSGAAVMSRASARIVGPAMSPVSVMPVAAAMGGVALMVTTLCAGSLVPGLRPGRALLGRGAAGCAGSRGRLVSAGFVTMRCLRPAMRGPTVIVMALIGQGLRPFLMEGQDKPHWRDAS